MMTSIFKSIRHHSSPAIAAVSAVSFLLAYSALAAPGKFGGGVSIIREMPEAVFAPPGFDSNDHSQVVVAGTFLNSCFKAGPASAEVDPLTHTIRVTQKAYYIDSSWCLQALIPYSTVVDVGVLPAGEYQVKVVADRVQEKSFGEMGIAAAKDSTLGPDESIYAIADDVSYSNGTLTLKGKLPSACSRLKEIRVLTRKANIVEVLPILETVSTNGAVECGADFHEFEKQVRADLPWKGRTLFHVRSLNGQAVNKVLELQ